MSFLFLFIQVVQFRASYPRRLQFMLSNFDVSGDKREHLILGHVVEFFDHFAEHNLNGPLRLEYLQKCTLCCDVMSSKCYSRVCPSARSCAYDARFVRS